MSGDVPEALVEKAAQALADSGCIHEERGFDCTSGCRVRAVLAAVYEDITLHAGWEAAQEAYQRGYDAGCNDPESVWTSTIAAVKREAAEEIAQALEAGAWAYRRASQGKLNAAAIRANQMEAAARIAREVGGKSP